jgi:hypothetical protein
MASYGAAAVASTDGAAEAGPSLTLGDADDVVPPQAAKTSASVAARAASGDHFGDRCMLILLMRPSAGHSVLPRPASLGAVEEA